MRTLQLLLLSLLIMCSGTTHAQLPTTVRVHLYDTAIQQQFVYDVQPAINGPYNIPEAAQRFYAEIPGYTLIYPHRQISGDSVLYISAFQDSLSKTCQPGTLTADLKQLSDTLSAREQRRLEKELWENPPKQETTYEYNGVLDGVYVRAFVHPDSVLPKHYVKYDSGKSDLYDTTTYVDYVGYRKSLQPWMDQQLQPFYICNHEVTNVEYRNFVHWVRDSIALDLLYSSIEDEFELLTLLNCPKSERKLLNPYERDENLKRYGLNHALCEGKNNIYENEEYIKLLEYGNFYYPKAERFYYRRQVDIRNLKYASMTTSPTPVYPDTLCWLKDHPFSFMDPFTNMYFWHPAYDNYPVVGLSLEQMKAYCDWLQRRVPEGVTVSLPSRYNYEMAVKTCVIPEQRSLISVDTTGLSAFTRSPGKMIFFINRTGLIPSHFKNPPSNSFIFNWYNTYQTSPVFDLAGSVSEVVTNQPHDSLAATHMLTTGGNWSKYVVSENEEPYNTTFYQQTVPVSGNSTTGFRIMLIPSASTGTPKAKK